MIAEYFGKSVKRKKSRSWRPVRSLIMTESAPEARLGAIKSRKFGGKHAKRESRKEARKATGSGPERPLAGTGLEDEVIFEFDVREYDFRECLQDMLQIQRSEQLHRLHLCDEAVAYSEAVKSTLFTIKQPRQDIVDNGPAPGRRGNPFLRRWKRVWSGEIEHPLKPARNRFESLLLRFARDFCAPRMGDEPCLFQREPTLRVVFPSPFATGRPHSDSEYHHQPAEINWWLPLSDEVFGGNTLHVESKPGLGDFHPLNLKYGQVCRFYGNKCMHYCVPNDTAITRVSIDFRTVPESYYDDTYTHLPSGYVPFRRGTYYRSSEEADEPLDLPDTAACALTSEPEQDDEACTEYQLDL